MNKWLNKLDMESKSTWKGFREFVNKSYIKQQHITYDMIIDYLVEDYSIYDLSGKKSIEVQKAELRQSLKARSTLPNYIYHLRNAGYIMSVTQGKYMILKAIDLDKTSRDIQNENRR